MKSVLKSLNALTVLILFLLLTANFIFPREALSASAEEIIIRVDSNDERENTQQ